MAETLSPKIIQWIIVFFISGWFVQGLFSFLEITQKENSELWLFLLVCVFWYLNALANEEIQDYREKHPSEKRLAEQRRELNEKMEIEAAERERTRVRSANRQKEIVAIERKRLAKEKLAKEQEELEKKRYLDRAKEEWGRYSSVADFNGIDSMSGRDFELAVKTLYTNMGYGAELTPITGDFGADVLVRIDEEQTSAIQVKRSRTNVGNKAVMEALAGMKHYNATHAIVLTNAKFTKAAMEQAKSAGVELIDRDILYDMWCIAFPTENKLGEFNMDKYEKNKRKIHAALYGDAFPTNYGI